MSSNKINKVNQGILQDSTNNVHADARTLTLRVNGVGWNAKVQSREIHLYVGYAHVVKIKIPVDIEVTVHSNGEGVNRSSNTPSSSVNQSSVQTAASTRRGNETLIELQSTCNKIVELGDFAAKIIRVRQWNSYRGQGIVRVDRMDNLIRRRGKRKA